MSKKIIFVTGTRADWGKLKSLVMEASSDNFDVHIFITGMHNDEKYGYTYIDVQRVKNVGFYRFDNKTSETSMDLTLSKTITGFSKYVDKINPDLIVIHGDRPEPLACAIVGSFKNILVAHIEGGEISGTIDELIRHSISKLSHIHFVSNEMAKNRLIQMGEKKESIFIIGSPDIDLMFSKDLPILKEAKKKYQISYDKYSIVLFHPVTTEIKFIKEQVDCLIDSVIESKKNYIIIYPNNDLGSDTIIDAYKKIKSNCVKILPSIRFEYFLTLLKNSEFIIGNSSAGIREAPYYSVDSINIGSRQNGRQRAKSVIDCGYNEEEIKDAIEKHLDNGRYDSEFIYGDGHAGEKIADALATCELKFHKTITY